MSTQMKKQALYFSGLIALFIGINLVSGIFYTRIDLTKEKRHSLTKASKNIINKIDDHIYVKVYLEGDFPAGFKRLRNATEDLLEEFEAYNPQFFEFEFIDPFEGADQKEFKGIFTELQKKGLTPTRIDNIEQASVENKYIFPGALITYQDKEIPVKLLQSQLGLSPAQALNNSVSSLEYNFISGVRKLLTEQKPRVGIIDGHGEMVDQLLVDFVESISEFYKVQRINLPDEILVPDVFQTIVIPKPIERFSEQEKYKIDQYIMNGGNVLWLVDNMIADMDSLQGKAAFSVMPRDLNLEDLFFQYGARVNQDVVQDQQCAPHPFVTGYTGNVPQQQLFDWYYFPVIIPTSEHPIVNNMDAVIQKFPSTIEAVGNSDIQQTPLLSTSKYSRSIYTGARVNLDIIQNKPQPGMLNKPFQATAMLLEGEFESLYKSRANSSFVKEIKEATGKDFVKKSAGSKQIIVADGDMIANSYDRQGNLYPIGFYPYTRSTFANKKFLINCMEYLTDDLGIMEANSKNVILRPLDATKINKEKGFWKTINLVIPILLTIVFGIIFNYVRLRKYKL